MKRHINFYLELKSLGPISKSIDAYLSSETPTEKDSSFYKYQRMPLEDGAI